MPGCRMLERAAGSRLDQRRANARIPELIPLPLAKVGAPELTPEPWPRASSGS
jgi:hypothetical protein